MALQPTLTRRSLCATLAALPLAAQARETLRVLAWPGYADPDIVRAFEQRTGAQVQVTYVDSDLDLWNKAGASKGRDYDVFAVNTAELQRYIRAGLVQPVDLSAVPNRRRQLPRFSDPRAISGLVHDGKTYGVPYTYSEMGLIYDRSQFQRPPTSIQVLWDEKYQGKVIAYSGGTHNFSLAAQLKGLPSPFQIPDSAWPELVDRLIALRRNVGAFYTQPEESLRLFRQHRAAVLYANFGSQQLKLLQGAGLNVGYAVPREGALAWLDCWAISVGARAPALAAAWINHLLEPAAGEALVQRQGLANTTTESPFLHPGAHLVWLEPLESEDRRNQMWTRLMAGARAAKVLAP